jgi:hypothetical protein
MDGFYELAKVFGGVEVCLRNATKDRKSGANFHAGYQHLDASQALAFVRQRDNLPNGDLDRTHRQQAFIDSVMQQLHKQGVLGDLSKIGTLLSVAKQYVITDSGLNLLDFAAQMRGLTSGNLVFHTLPIKGYAAIDGQDANAVDPTYIKSIIKVSFYPKPAPRRPSPLRAAPGPLRAAPGPLRAAPGPLRPRPAPRRPRPAPRRPKPSASHASSAPVLTKGPQGGAVHAVNGIPCVN